MSSQTVDVPILLSEQQAQDLQCFVEATAQGRRHDVPAGRLKSLAKLGLVRSKLFFRYELTAAGSAVSERLNPELANELLDERMQANGMFSVAQMLKGVPMDMFTKHAGVHDLDTFGEWIEMKRTEYVRLHARYALGDRAEDELYEWSLAHNAVFAAVHVNFKAAMAGSTGVTDKKWHCKTCCAQWEGLLADHTCPDGREDVSSGWRA